MRTTLFLVAFLLVGPALNGQAPANLKNMDLDAIDRSCKPCDDFFQFSMGKWHEQNPIPGNQTVWSKRWAGADGNRDVLKGILEGLAATRNRAGSNEQLLGDFYAACTSTDAIDTAAATPLAAPLQRIASISDRRALERAIADLHRDGVPVAFEFGSIPDTDNPRQMIGGIGPGMLGLPDRDYYLKDDPASKTTQERYRRHVETLLAAAGLSPSAASTSAATVIRLETQQARARLSRADRRDPYKINNRRSPAELATLTPHFNWRAYSEAIGLDYNGLVLVTDLAFMSEFDRELEQVSLDDWKALLTWDVVRARARDLSAPFRDEMFAFVDRTLNGQREPRSRWQYCVDRTDALLGEALGKAYVEKVFPPAAKQRVQEMVKNLLAALDESIRGLEWMTPETKRKALVKLAAFTPKIAYPDKWRDYPDVRVSRTSFFDSVVSAERFAQTDDRDQIGKPVDRTRWGMTAPTSNAYYSPLANEIVFPAGILTPPMFSMDADDAVNYGGIGVVIGHEISHGFDDQGSQFDADGRLTNWWTAEDRKRFDERTACVADQFNNYFIEPGTGHNGRLVLGEAIGDLAGVRIAYLAYLKSLEGKPRPPDIGGFTPEQRFFLGWGQSRGDNMRIERQRVYVVSDPHPVAKYRVIGPLSNMPEFQKAFGCQPGDPMVRTAEKACRVW
jgi:endothelin-converting enzyme/putative endopeptidase